MFCNTLWATTHQIRKGGLAQLPLYKESEKWQLNNVNIFCELQRTNLLLGYPESQEKKTKGQLIHFCENSIKGCSINSGIAASLTNFISGHYAKPSRHIPGFISVTMPGSIIKARNLT